MIINLGGPAPAFILTKDSQMELILILIMLIIGITLMRVCGFLKQIAEEVYLSRLNMIDRFEELIIIVNGNNKTIEYFKQQTQIAKEFIESKAYKYKKALDELDICNELNTRNQANIQEYRENEQKLEERISELETSLNNVSDKFHKEIKENQELKILASDRMTHIDELTDREQDFKLEINRLLTIINQEAQQHKTEQEESGQ